MDIKVKDYPKKLKNIIKERAGNDYDENLSLLSQFIFDIQPEGFEHWFNILEKYEGSKVDKMFLDEFLDDEYCKGENEKVLEKVTKLNTDCNWLHFDALDPKPLDDIEVNEPEIVSDSIVDKVVESFKERSNVGIKKYGVTLDRDDLSPLEWISHLQEELQDAILYAEKLKSAKCICKSSDMAEDKKETTYPLLKVERVCIKSPIGSMNFGVNEVSLKYSLDGKTVTLDIV